MDLTTPDPATLTALTCAISPASTPVCLRTAEAGLEFRLPGGVIHGDAHRGNLMRRADGVVVLGDFEEVSIGPREWDLTPTAVNLVRFSLSEAAYRRFADGYGFDVMAWEGFGVLQRMRELTATSWLMQNVNESPVIAEEFELRVASMQGAPMRRPWQPF